MLQRTPDHLRQILEHALHARGLLHNSSIWYFLEGGRTNWLWRVSRPDGDIVVKLYSGKTSNPLFPNDPRSETLALEHLAGLGIAPRLLERFRTDAGTCVIYAHLEGAPWVTDCRPVATLLHQLHQITPPSGLRKAPDGSAALCLQAMKILADCPEDRVRLLRKLQPKVQAAPIGAACLLHADPVPANMIAQEDGLKLIDWQCPAIGDPCEDIAVFLSPAMQIIYRGAALSAAERNAFLGAYPDEVTIQRYLRLEPWFHWRMAAYCQWKEARGDKLAAHACAAEIDALRAALSEQI